MESLKKEILSLKIKSIKSDYEILKVNERLNYENIINLAYSNIAQRKISYLEAYIQSLKNIIINLSNPYNFNLWRKISNILLKNIFIILKNKGFTINQNKDKTVYDDLSEIIHKMKKPDYKIIKKLNKYKNCLEEIKQTTVLSSSPAADKKRVFNLITIEKDKTAEIKFSLSIDFLFFLKEKGNKFSHFDESILNYLLFNDLNIIEENEINETEIKSEKKNKRVNDTEDVKEKNNKNEETKGQKNTGKIINEDQNNKIKAKSIDSTNVGINSINLKNEPSNLNKIDKIKSKSTEHKKFDNKIYGIEENILKTIEPKDSQKKIIEEVKLDKFKNIINNKVKAKSTGPKDTIKISNGNKKPKNTAKIIENTEQLKYTEVDKKEPEKIRLDEPKDAKKMVNDNNINLEAIESNI